MAVRDDALQRGRIYTAHGKKLLHGGLAVVNGKKALVLYKGKEIVGYTTLEELNREFYTRELPELSLKF